MSTENSNTNKPEKEFNFIQQQIVPKKKNKTKRILFILLYTIILAVIFGFISRAVFRFSEPLFNRIFGLPNNNDHITFPSVHPEDETDKEAEIQRPEPAPETIIIERPIEIDVTSFVNMYSQINDVAEEVNHSIVMVTSVVNGVDLFENIYEAEDVTSGLILDNTGDKIYILASNSKIKGANNLKVTLNSQTTIPAKLHNHDSDLDLAIVVIETNRVPKEELNKLKEAKLGESYTISAGEPIMALGSPNGYAYSMELGTISSKFNYSYVTDSKVELFNTTINDNSRGAGVIANMKGEVIGILTQNFKDNLNKGINTNFAISKLKPVIEDLVNKEERIYFGIVGADMSSDIAKSYDVESGIFVTNVEANSPAFEAGIQNGDIIVKVEDSNIINMTSFYNILKNYKPKDKVKVVIKRSTKSKDNNMELDVILENKESKMD